MIARWRTIQPEPVGGVQAQQVQNRQQHQRERQSNAVVSQLHTMNLRLTRIEEARWYC
jgi:hypothetical protein